MLFLLLFLTSAYLRECDQRINGRFVIYVMMVLSIEQKCDLISWLEIVHTAFYDKRTILRVHWVETQIHVTLGC